MADSVRIDTDTRKRDPEKPGLVTRIRRKQPWIDHLMRAYDAYSERYGAHYAAAITYFSVLSLFPIVLLAFSALGFVLYGNIELQHRVQAGITEAVPPGPLQGLISQLINTAISSRGSTGIIGLVIALYSGIGWMGNLRNALTAQWGVKKPEISLIPMLLKDLAALVGLGIALLFSFGLTALASGFTKQVLEWLGLAQQGWAHFLLVALEVVLSVAANWLVFIWVIARLPRAKVSAKSAVRGALIMAIGFEVLKQVMTIYLRSLQGQPAFALFGPILGLMIFANFVSQLLLFTTAWIATARENQRVQVPEPGAVVHPVIGVSSGPSGAQVAGLLGVGTVLGMLLRRRR